MLQQLFDHRWPIKLFTYHQDYLCRQGYYFVALKTKENIIQLPQ